MFRCRCTDDAASNTVGDMRLRGMALVRAAWPPKRRTREGGRASWAAGLRKARSSSYLADRRVPAADRCIVDLVIQN